jgi:hypothetical protein
MVSGGLLQHRGGVAVLDDDNIVISFALASGLLYLSHPTLAACRSKLTIRVAINRNAEALHDAANLAK